VADVASAQIRQAIVGLRVAGESVGLVVVKDEDSEARTEHLKGAAERQEKRDELLHQVKVLLEDVVQEGAAAFAGDKDDD
jgi:hypothetical protein